MHGNCDFHFGLGSTAGSWVCVVSCCFEAYLLLPFERKFFFFPLDWWHEEEWTPFTSEVFIGVRFDFSLDKVEVEVGVDIDNIFSLVEDDDGYVLTKPIIPSACDLGARLDGSLVGWGALGISSYKVPNWEKTKSNYWAQLIAFSSVTTPPMETSWAMGGKSDLVNQSTRSWSRFWAFINLLNLLHSWIWSEIWVEVDCQREVRSLVPVS